VATLAKPEPRGPKPPKPLKRTPLKRASAPIKRGKRPRRERKTPLAKLKRAMWTLFAGYVKGRDGNRCISCPATGLEGSNWHAGHFFTSGAHGNIRFHPKNVHSQCGRCNVWLRGNVANYAVAFLDRYGETEFRNLQAKSQQARAPWTRQEVIDFIAALAKPPHEFECWYFERYGP
jgi:hypothetical protein